MTIISHPGGLTGIFISSPLLAASKQCAYSKKRKSMYGGRRQSATMPITVAHRAAVATNRNILGCEFFAIHTNTITKTRYGHEPITPANAWAGKNRPLGNIGTRLRGNQYRSGDERRKNNKKSDCSRSFQEPLNEHKKPEQRNAICGNSVPVCIREHPLIAFLADQCPQEYLSGENPEEEIR